MKISQLGLQAFEAIAKTGSFTKASAKLHVSQSALSHRIKLLESELETTVFTRQADGIRLTTFGFKLLEHCRTRNQIEDEFLHETGLANSRGLAGTLRVGGTSTLVRSILYPSLTPLLQENPRIILDMKTREISELHEAFSHSDIDFIMTTRRISQSNIVETYIGEENNVLVESAVKSICIRDAYLDHDFEDATTLDYFRLQNKKSIHLERSFMDDIYGILDGVRAGLGRAVVPWHLVADHKKDFRVIKGRALSYPVYLYFNRQSFYSKLHLAARERLIEKATDLLASIKY